MKRVAVILAGAALLSACAVQADAAVAAGAPGFLLGLWHGFIFPVAWLLFVTGVLLMLLLAVRPGR